LQRQLTCIQVAIRVSWISEHDDVIPSEMSTACQCTTVKTLRCSLQCARVCQFTLIRW